MTRSAGVEDHFLTAPTAGATPSRRVGVHDRSSGRDLDERRVPRIVSECYFPTLKTHPDRDGAKRRWGRQEKSRGCFFRPEQVGHELSSVLAPVDDPIGRLPEDLAHLPLVDVIVVFALRRASIAIGHARLPEHGWRHDVDVHDREGGHEAPEGFEHAQVADPVDDERLSRAPCVGVEESLGPSRGSQLSESLLAEILEGSPIEGEGSLFSLASDEVSEGGAGAVEPEREGLREMALAAADGPADGQDDVHPSAASSCRDPA